MGRAYAVPAILCFLILTVAACALEMDDRASSLLAYGGGGCLAGGVLLAGFEFLRLNRVYDQVPPGRVLWWTVLLNFFGSLSCFCLSAFVFVPAGLFLMKYVGKDVLWQDSVIQCAFVVAVIVSWLLAAAVEYALLRRLQRGRQEIEPARLKRVCLAMNGTTHGVVLVALVVFFILVAH